MEKKEKSAFEKYSRGKYRIRQFIAKFADFLGNNSVFCKAKSLIQKILGEEGWGLSVHTLAFIVLMEKFSVFLNRTQNSGITIFNQSTNYPTNSEREKIFS